MPLDPITDKAALRLECIASRRARTVEQRTIARDAIGQHLLDFLGNSLPAASRICGYQPLPTEPISVDLLNDLVALGHQVLVPAVTGAAPLDWTTYQPGHEPSSVYLPTGERLGADAITSAAAVIIPAFAVDDQGFRLGRGGGHYDRSLALAMPATLFIATLFDGERRPNLPRDAFDIPVNHVASPTAGVQSVCGAE